MFLFCRWYCRCARRGARRWQRWERYFVRAALSRLEVWQTVQSVGVVWSGGMRLGHYGEGREGVE